MMISVEQIKAARMLLRLSVFELADLAGVSSSTIKRLESLTDDTMPRAETVVKVQASLETQGIEFLGTVDDSPGVRLHRRALTPSL